MVYYTSEKLNIIELECNLERLYFKDFFSLIGKRPCNMSYITSDGRLQGIISAGDIKRAKENGQEFVRINRNFTSITNKNYAEAKRIFSKLLNICDIPVVDEKGKLIGSYIRATNVLELSLLKLYFNNCNCQKWKQDYTNEIVFVRPIEENVFQNELLEEWKDIFIAEGVETKIIKWDELAQNMHTDAIVVFWNSYDYISIKTLYNDIHGEELVSKKCVTCKELYDKVIGDCVVELNTRVTYRILQSLEKQGVKVLLLEQKEDSEGTYSKLCEECRKRFEKYGVNIQAELPLELIEMRKDFFGEVYSEEYKKAIIPFPFSINNINGVLGIEDVETSLFNVRNGMRVTTNQPKNYDRCIYLYGPCVIMGTMVEDKHTIGSFLQNMTFGYHQMDHKTESRLK